MNPVRIEISADTSGIDQLVQKLQAATEAAKGLGKAGPGPVMGGGPPEVAQEVADRAKAWHDTVGAAAGQAIPIPGMPGAILLPPSGSGGAASIGGPMVAVGGGGGRWGGGGGALVPMPPPSSGFPVPAGGWPGVGGGGAPGGGWGWPSWSFNPRAIGMLGSQAIGFGMTGNPAGLVQSGFGLMGNPWALAAGLIGGAGVAAGFSSISSTAEAYGGLLNALSDAAPFAFPGTSLAYAQQMADPRRFHGAAALGFSPEEAVRAVGAYSRVSGLGDAGLPMSVILGAQRSRGLDPGTLGAFSSMFAAGGGAASTGTQAQVIQTLSFAIGEAMQAGLKNAGLPQYLAAVHDAVQRTSSQGLRTDPFGLLRTVDSIRQADPGRFAGTIAPRVAGDVQGYGASLAQSFMGIVPAEAMQSAMRARILSMAGGDPEKAALLAEQLTEGGDMLGVMQSVASGSGSAFIAASMLKSALPLGAGQALALARSRGGGALHPEEFDLPFVAQQAFSTERVRAAYLALKDVTAGAKSYNADSVLKKARSDFQTELAEFVSKPFTAFLGDQAMQYNPEVFGKAGGNVLADLGFTGRAFDANERFVSRLADVFRGVFSGQTGSNMQRVDLKPKIIIPHGEDIHPDIDRFHGGRW